MRMGGEGGGRPRAFMLALRPNATLAASPPLLLLMRARRGRPSANAGPPPSAPMPKELPPCGCAGVGVWVCARGCEGWCVCVWVRGCCGVVGQVGARVLWGGWDWLRGVARGR